MASEELEFPEFEKLATSANWMIAQRRKAEDALREHRKLMDLTLSASSIGLGMAKDRKIAWANEAMGDLFGLSIEELEGADFRTLYATENEYDRVGKILYDHQERDQAVELDAEFRRSDGSLFYGQYRATYLDATDASKGVILSLVDITERKRAEEKLSESRRLEAIGQLAGGVAHDFNNQLAGIINFAGLLLRNQSNDRTRKYADMILHTARRSADLTSQLLAFSRKAELKITPVDIHALVEEVVSLLSHTIDRRIAITQRLDADPPTTMGDVSQLQSALLNLAINARDAMPDGGELGLATDVVTLDEAFCRAHPHGITPGPFLLISISDTGTGIEASALSHIFEPFFTTKKPGTGTGLGLAAVYGTVKSHKGAIDVESELGQGSVFSIYLPHTPTQKPTPPVQKQPAAPTDCKGTILLVDDERSVRESSCEALRDLGYTVVPSENGVDAVNYYQAHWQTTDLVILDMMMPQVNGHDAFRSMRRINPTAKVMLLSGFSLNSAVQAVLDEGALDYLPKPFDLPVLYDKVARLISAEEPAPDRH